jgi:glycerol-1-phosphate dehydrogenase [NAD(P)+]
MPKYICLYQIPNYAVPLTMNRIKPPTMGLDECIAASGGTKALLTGNDLYPKIPELLKQYFDSRRVFIIADENTMTAAGNDLEKILLADGIEVAGRHIFPAEPRLHAEYGHIETLIGEINKKQKNSSPPLVPVAVGSGAINDLVKRAAEEVSLPYLCVPTAASVDGYTSFGSAVLKDGFKQTLPCAAPPVIAADTGVMAAAPAWLSSSGFGDLAGKIIAGADWIISEAAAAFGAKGAAPIDRKAWAMVQHGLYHYLDRSVNAAQGDQDALKALFEALSITGFAMQYTRDSRPVSGAEHLFAHVWEMDDLCVNGNPVTHGHKVVMGALACTAFLEVLFADPDGPLGNKGSPPLPASFRRPSLDERVAEVSLAFKNSPALESALKTAVDKFPSDAIIKKTVEGFRDTWKELRAKVFEQILPYSELKAMLIKAQCPVLPHEINLSRAEVIACARRAQMIRMRYSLLDLAWDLGCFETVLAEIETSDKYLK